MWGVFFVFSVVVDVDKNRIMLRKGYVFEWDW